MNDLENLFEAFRRTTLLERERAAMRGQLQEYIRVHPARIHGTMSWSVRVGMALKNFLSVPEFSAHPAFAACVLVLCVSVGASYMAQSAVPGQALYALKTQVNEPLQGAFAVSPEAKAQWNAELANRRLTEAEVLASTGELSLVVSDDLQKKIDLAVTNFNSNVTLLAEKDDTQASDEQSDLEASLNAHEVTLASLAGNTKSGARMIAASVREHADKITSDRVKLQALVSATDTPAVQIAALGRKKSAEDTLKKTKEMSTHALDSATASSLVSVAEEAKKDLQAGEQEAKNGRWGKAYRAFQDAYRKAKESKDSAEARSKLKVQLSGLATTTTATSAASLMQTTASSTATSSEDSKKGKEEDTEKGSD